MKELKRRHEEKGRPTKDEMDKAIEDYRKAKADGTLDEKYPVIGHTKDLLE